MGRVLLDPSHEISLRVDRAFLPGEVSDIAGKGRKGGIIWKKKKKNGRNKVVCFDNKTG